MMPVTFLEVSYLPLTNISGVSIPRLILGNMPFVGESYQGEEKNRKYRQRFSKIENTIELLRRAVEKFGVTTTVIMPSSDRFSALFLDAIRETEKQTKVEFNLIPCFPIPLTIEGHIIDDYKRWVTYYHVEKRAIGKQLLEKYVNDPILQCREGWKQRFPDAIMQLKPHSAEEIEKLQIDYKFLEKAMMRLEGFKIILAESGSESDFLALTGRVDLLNDLSKLFRDRFSCPSVVGIHHAGSTIPILEKNDTAFAGYITPVNKLGALMLPSSNLALDAIRGSRKPVIAIKPLAGGRVAVNEALRYVYREVGVQACMVGVASKEEMDEDFYEAGQLLKE